MNNSLIFISTPGPTAVCKNEKSHWHKFLPETHWKLELTRWYYYGQPMRVSRGITELGGVRVWDGIRMIRA